MSTSSTPQSSQSIGLPDIEQILGLAVFDVQGLPLECFKALQSKDMEWIQLVFQALGLQYLLASEMELPQLDHALIRIKTGNIIIVRTQQGYAALLIKRSRPQEQPTINQDWVNWIGNFEKNIVRQHSNFQPI